MQKNICQISTCVNYQRYCRVHLVDEEKQSKTDVKSYLKVREAFLKEHKTCEVGTCGKPAKEVHHKKGRSKKFLCDPKTFMAVCSGHHKFITEHPHFAKEHGYSESRLSHENKTV